MAVGYFLYACDYTRAGFRVRMICAHCVCVGVYVCIVEVLLRRQLRVCAFEFARTPPRSVSEPTTRFRWVSCARACTRARASPRCVRLVFVWGVGVQVNFLRRAGAQVCRVGTPHCEMSR
jgi:hypothetical protein